MLASETVRAAYLGSEGADGLLVPELTEPV
jgi:hypothetical protein